MADGVGVKVTLLPQVDAGSLQSAVNAAAGKITLNISDVVIAGKNREKVSVAAKVDKISFDTKALDAGKKSIEGKLNDAKAKVKIDLDQNSLKVSDDILKSIRSNLSDKGIVGAELERAVRNIGATASESFKEVTKLTSTINSDGTISLNVDGVAKSLNKTISLAMKYDLLTDEIEKHSVKTVTKITSTEQAMASETDAVERSFNGMMNALTNLNKAKATLAKIDPVKDTFKYGEASAAVDRYSDTYERLFKTVSADMSALQVQEWTEEVAHGEEMLARISADKSFAERAKAQDAAMKEAAASAKQAAREQIAAAKQAAKEQAAAEAEAAKQRASAVSDTITAYQKAATLRGQLYDTRLRDAGNGASVNAQLAYDAQITKARELKAALGELDESEQKRIQTAIDNWNLVKTQKERLLRDKQDAEAEKAAAEAEAEAARQRVAAEKLAAEELSTALKEQERVRADGVSKYVAEYSKLASLQQQVHAANLKDPTSVDAQNALEAYEKQSAIVEKLAAQNRDLTDDEHARVEAIREAMEQSEKFARRKEAEQAFIAADKERVAAEAAAAKQRADAVNETVAAYQKAATLRAQLYDTQLKDAGNGATVNAQLAYDAQIDKARELKAVLGELNESEQKRIQTAVDGWSLVKAQKERLLRDKKDAEVEKAAAAAEVEAAKQRADAVNKYIAEYSKLESLQQKVHNENLKDPTSVDAIIAADAYERQSSIVEQLAEQCGELTDKERARVDAIRESMERSKEYAELRAQEKESASADVEIEKKRAAFVEQYVSTLKSIQSLSKKFQSESLKDSESLETKDVAEVLAREQEKRKQLYNKIGDGEIRLTESEQAQINEIERKIALEDRFYKIKLRSQELSKEQAAEEDLIAQREADVAKTVAAYEKVNSVQEKVNRARMSGNGVAYQNAVSELQQAEANANALELSLKGLSASESEAIERAKQLKVSTESNGAAMEAQAKNVEALVASMREWSASQTKLSATDKSDEAATNDLLRRVEAAKQAFASAASSLGVSADASSMTTMAGAVDAVTVRLNELGHTNAVDSLNASVTGANASFQTLKSNAVDAANGLLNTLNALRGSLVGEGVYTETSEEIKTLDEIIGKLEDDIRLVGESSQNSFQELNAGLKKTVAEASNATSGFNKIISDMKPVNDMLADAIGTKKLNPRIASSDYAGRLDDVVKGLEAIRSRGKYTQAEMDKLRETLSEVKLGIKEGGLEGGTLVSQFAKIGKTAFGAAITGQIFMFTRQAVREMLTSVKEIDDAMTQLKIVTQATDSQMSAFFKGAANQAKELGASVSDVLASVETFSRLGYNLADALQLSDVSTILGNVADTTVDAATTGVTSILKAYSMDPSDATHIADVLVAVGQKYAISAEELMEAFQRGGAALYATGTDFEKSAALFAAANAAIQDSSTVGTALKTVSARIRGAKSELTEMGESTEDVLEGFSKYRKELLGLTGFDILEEGTVNDYKDIYDIFYGISEIWGDLSETSQARVSEILGGTRQLSVISSILNNISDAEGAYETAINSAGVATQANEVYMDSISAKINQLHAQWQLLSSAILDSSIVKGIISFANVIVKALTGVVDFIKMIPAPVLATAALALFAKQFDNIFGAIGKAGKAMQEWNYAFSTIGSGLEAMSGAATSAKVSLAGLVKLAAANPFATLAVGAVAASAMVLAYVNHINSLKYKMDQAADSISSFNDSKTGVSDIGIELKTVNDQIDEIKSKGAITLADKEDLKTLERQRTELEQQLAVEERIEKINQDKAARSAAAVLSSTDIGNRGYVSADSMFMEPADSRMTYIQKLINQQGELNQLTQRRAKLLAEQSDLARKTNLTKEESKQFDSLGKQIESIDNRRANLESDLANAATTIKSYIGVFTDDDGSVLSGFEAEYDSCKQFLDMFVDGADSAASSMEIFKQSLSSGNLDSAFEEISSWDESKLADEISLVARGSDEANESLRSVIDAALDAGVITSIFSDDVSGVLATISDLGYITVESVEDSVARVVDIEDAFKTMTDNASSLNDALSAGVSATGLSHDNVNAIKAIYASVEGYDAEKLFERTATGIKLNTEELSRLNSEYDKQQKSNYANVLSSLEDEFDSLTERINNCTSASEQTSLISQRDAIVAQIHDVSNLATQYDGLTSAYNRWTQAQSGGDFGDMYDKVTKGFESAKDLYEKGLVGTNEFKSFVQMLTYDDVSNKSSAEIVDLYEKKVSSLGKYFTEGQEGAQAFLDTLVKVGAATKGENGYAIDFEDDDLAKKLDIDVSLITTMMDKLQAYGFEINFGSANKQIDELNEKIANTKTVLLDAGTEPKAGLDGIIEKLVSLGHASEEISFDLTTSDPDSLSQQLDMAQAIMRTFREYDEESGGLVINTSLEGYGEAAALLDILMQRVQQLNAPVIMDVDTSMVNGAVGDILPKLQELNNLFDQKDRDVAIGADTSAVDAAIEQATAEIRNWENSESVNATILATLGIDTGASAEAVRAAISSISAESMIEVGVNADAIMSYTPEDKAATVTYDIVKTPGLTAYENAKVDKSALVTYDLKRTSALLSFNPKDIERTVTYKVKTSGSVPGNAGANGTFGHAFAVGTAGISRSQDALVNELGEEMLVRDGKYQVIQGGAQFIHLKKGDIIFNHKQTEEILKNGYVTSDGGRGEAFYSGTGNAFATTGSGSLIAGKGASSSASKKKKSTSSKKSSKKSSSKKSSSKKSKSKTKSEAEYFDWIEVRIERIEQLIDSLQNTVDNSFISFTKRGNAVKKEITAINNELEVQKKAYDYYIKQANKVGLSAAYKKKVQNGAIDIDSIKDDKLKKKIKDYQEWYNKAVGCKSAIEELKVSLSEMAKQSFDLIVTRFDGIIGHIEGIKNRIDGFMDRTEAAGYKVSEKYYSELIKEENKNLTRLKEEQKALIESLNNAIDSGAITLYSEAWYEMQEKIDDVTDSITEATTSIIEYQNAIRQLKWDAFDDGQAAIGDIIDEANFLIDLLSDSDMFDDGGAITDAGMAAQSLHAQNYNSYMSQSDRYAKEIQAINKEIAKDPYNTILLERRKELIESQREAILAANDEKKAIQDLVKEGVDAELDALKELIDAYQDSVDSAKDLYDYQEKIGEQSKKISALEKQLSAYSGDTSEEAKKTVQQLKTDLADAQKDLQDTQYDRYVSDTKDILGKLYDEYELLLNERVDDVDGLLLDAIESANNNADSVAQTITSAAGDVGISVSKEMMSIWGKDGAGGVLTAYSENFSAASTNLNLTLTNILQKVSAIYNAANSQAKSDVLTMKNYIATGGSTTKGYASGARSIYSSGLAWTQERGPEAILRPSDGALLTPLAKGDSVLNANATSNIWEMANNPKDFIAGNLDGRYIGAVSATPNGERDINNTIYLNMDLSGIHNYSEFMNAARVDPKFEKLVQAMTTDRLAGKSSHSKNSISW